MTLMSSSDTVPRKQKVQREQVGLTTKNLAAEFCRAAWLFLRYIAGQAWQLVLVTARLLTTWRWSHAGLWAASRSLL